jgi:hypothetical protein
MQKTPFGGFVFMSGLCMASVWVCCFMGVLFYARYVLYGFYDVLRVLCVFYECLKPRFRSVLYSAFFLYIYLFKYILFFFLKKEYI